MKLTPLDIRKQEFKRIMRGFDPEEVEAFLTMIADEFELLIREKNQLNDELIKLRTQLKDYQQVESTLRDTLVKAQNNVEESRSNTRREAEIIIHEAELQAEHIVKDAKDELNDIRHDIEQLQTQKQSFAKRLRHLLLSQLELLQVLDMNDVNFDELMNKVRRPERERPNFQVNTNVTQPVEKQQRPVSEPEEDDSNNFPRSEPRIIRNKPIDDSSDDDESLSDQVII